MPLRMSPEIIKSLPCKPVLHLFSFPAYPPENRPTFVFLRGSSKVDQVRGANRGCVPCAPYTGLRFVDFKFSSCVGPWSLPFRSMPPARVRLHFLAKVRQWGVLLPQHLGETIITVEQTFGDYSANSIPKYRFCWH